MPSLRAIFLAILWLLPMGLTHAQQPQWRLANGTEGIDINDIAVSPSNPDTLYAIGSEDFLFSADRGENWQIIPNAIEGGAWAALKVDLLDSRRVYASHYYSFQGSNAVSKTGDGGFTWQLLFFGTFMQAAVVEIDPSDYRVIYAGQGPSWIRKSSDRGESWELLPTDSTMGGFYDLAIAPTNSQVLYAAYLGGIFKSSDGGNQWERLPLNIPLHRPRVAVDPRDEDMVYATSINGDSAGVFKSVDGGFSWKAMNNGLTENDRDIRTIEINPANPQELYVGTGSPQNDLVFKSINGGEDWFIFSAGLPGGAHVTSIKIDTLNRKLYAGLVASGNLDGIYIYDEITSINDDPVALPEVFFLEQNYPNPFNPLTIIPFTISMRAFVSLVIYDISGKQIITLLQGYQTPGRHEIIWNAEGLAGGMYFYCLSAGTHTLVRKALLIK